MSEVEEGLGKVFNSCVELFKKAETVFPEKKDRLSSGYWFNLENGTVIHILGGRWSVLNHCKSSKDLLRFEIEVKLALWEAAKLSRFRGLLFTPSLIIEKDEEGHTRGEVEYWQRLGGAQKQTIPVDLYPSKPITFLERVYRHLTPVPNSIRAILTNPELKENASDIPYPPQDQCWPVTRLVA